MLPGDRPPLRQRPGFHPLSMADPGDHPDRVTGGEGQGIERLFRQPEPRHEERNLRVSVVFRPGPDRVGAAGSPPPIAGVATDPDPPLKSRSVGVMCGHPPRNGTGFPAPGGGIQKIEDTAGERFFEFQRRALRQIGTIPLVPEHDTGGSAVRKNLERNSAELRFPGRKHPQIVASLIGPAAFAVAGGLVAERGIRRAAQIHRFYFRGANDRAPDRRDSQSDRSPTSPQRHSHSPCNVFLLIGPRRLRMSWSPPGNRMVQPACLSRSRQSAARATSRSAAESSCPAACCR